MSDGEVPPGSSSRRTRGDSDLTAFDSVFASVFDAVPDAMLVVDGDGIIRRANHLAELMFRFESGAMAGQSVESLIPKRMRHGHIGMRQAYQQRPTARPMGAGRWLQALRADGSEFAVEISLSPLTLRGDVVTCVAVRDATERKRFERELMDAQQSAERANAAKSEFLSSMSHELRTPLNAILGFAQLLERDKQQPLTARQLERLAHVQRGGQHLLRLIDEILDLSRIESGAVAMTLEPVSIAAVVQDVLKTLEPMASHAGVTLRLDTVVTCPEVVADRMRLTQILLNYGSNAIKYGRAGGTVTIRVQPRTATVRIIVSDDGHGIPHDQQDRIFEAFHRAGQEAGPIEGTGIGLAISKKLAQLMEGSVGFRSSQDAPHPGSDFWVDLRVAEASDAPIAPSTSIEHPTVTAPSSAVAALSAALSAARTTETRDTAAARRHLVVYIEDNPSNIAFMSDALSEYSHIQLLTAHTAELGLSIIEAHRPQLVLMDINLPGRSGIDALAQMRDTPALRSIPVVALTAAASRVDLERVRSAGFDGCLVKPISLHELAEILARFVPP